MSVSGSIIRITNKIFKLPVHPFNLANDKKMSYAEWQYEKGAETVKYYKQKYKNSIMFEGKNVLDIGCGAAGKSLYYIKMGAERVVGIDIIPKYEREATDLAKKLGYSERFVYINASADELPYPDNSFDTIIINDAMEHFSRPEEVLTEAIRLLRPNGNLFINFPPYGHPYGAHLSDAIALPWSQYLIPESGLIDSYKSIVKDLPDGKERINMRIYTDRNGNEHLGYINKMTISRFKKILRSMNIKPNYYAEIPLRKFLLPLSKIPFIKEIFVKMVVCVLIKPDPEAQKAELKNTNNIR